MLNHLIYADDLLIFAKANLLSTGSIKSFFTNLERFDGLTFNYLKSSIFFGKGVDNKDRVLQELKVQSACLPIKYPGVPLSEKLRTVDFGDLIDEINSSLNSWSCRFLNTGKGVELTKKTTISPVIQIWMPIFRFLRLFYVKLNELCADFL